MRKSFFQIILKRLLTSLLLIFLLISVTFILLRLAPGNFTQKFLSPELSPKLSEQVSSSFSLDASISEQYFNFLSNLAVGNFGISYNYRAPVLKVIGDYIPVTAILAFVCLLVQLIIAGSFANLSSGKFNGRLDRFITQLSLVFFSTPAFVLGVVLLMLFSDVAGVLPSSGIKSFDFNSLSFGGKFFDYSSHLLLPVLTISLGGSAVFYKYIRDGLEETYNHPMVLYLRANGYSEKEIKRKHVIPNAIGALISAAGVELGILLGGTLITEVIFGLPGMGRLTINAILTRDYPLVVGCTLIAGVFIIFSNFLADIIRAVIDRRTTIEMIN